MILIADSGSSKTNWVAINTDLTVIHYNSVGINPFFASSDDIFKITESTFRNTKIKEITQKIYFYGTGCIKNQNTNIVEEGLQRFFKQATITIEDDMFGAARSIFGKEKGIACILGTGANSCKYDGSNIIEKIPALGYILGDEASGAYFGKILINNFFKKGMPAELSQKFTEQFHPELGEILNKVYKQPYPNRFLANFTYFLSDNLEHAYIQNLLSNGFEAFISGNITKYSNYQNFRLGFVGSIAFHFSEILIQTCSRFNITTGNIIERPIEGLIQYHLQNL